MKTLEQLDQMNIKKSKDLKNCGSDLQEDYFDQQMNRNDDANVRDVFDYSQSLGPMVQERGRRMSESMGVKTLD